MQVALKTGASPKSHRKNSAIVELNAYWPAKQADIVLFDMNAVTGLFNKHDIAGPAVVTREQNVLSVCRKFKRKPGVWHVV